MSIITYKMIEKSEFPPVTLSETKDFLRIDQSDTSEDTVISMMLNAAVQYAEKYMCRDIRETTYERYTDVFYCSNDGCVCCDGDCIELRRGGFLSLEKIEYLKDGTYEELSSDNYTVKVGGIFGHICELDFDDDLDDDCNAIKITFKTGFDESVCLIPADLKQAILMHTAFLYENRGDCALDYTLPMGAKVIYDNYKIIDISNNVSC